jgi:hypothetical protein
MVEFEGVGVLAGGASARRLSAVHTLADAPVRAPSELTMPAPSVRMIRYAM